MLIKNNKKMSAQVLLDSVSDSAPLKTFDRNENPKKIIRIKKTSKKQSKAPESVNISNHIEDIIQSTENDIEINQKTKVTIDELRSYNTSWLKKYMA